MQGFFVVVIILVIVIGMYLGSYVLNSKTEVPEGIIIDPGCEGCSSMSCSLHSNPNPNEDCERKIETVKK